MNNNIKSDIDGCVLRLKIDRRAAKNALTPDMYLAIVAGSVTTVPHTLES